MSARGRSAASVELSDASGESSSVPARAPTTVKNTMKAKIPVTTLWRRNQLACELPPAAPIGGASTRGEGADCVLKIAWGRVLGPLLAVPVALTASLVVWIPAGRRGRVHCLESLESCPKARTGKDPNLEPRGSCCRGTAAE